MLQDLRQYSEVYPASNIIIQQAQQVCAGKLDVQEFQQTLANVLRQENDALINVALNLSPSLAVSQTIWNTLNLAINTQDVTLAQIFAIPLVLVLGSKTKTKIKSVLPTAELNNFLHDAEIFGANSDAFVSGKLIEPATIAVIKPSQLYYWVRNSQQAQLWLPIDVEPQDLEVLNEGVFLRFLVGVSINSTVNNDKFKQHAMQLMHLIQENLQTDGVTMFAIPFAPVSLSEASAIGNEKRTEIALQVALSNIVKKIRIVGAAPLAKLESTVDAIQITLYCDERPDLREISLWNLSRFADFNAVMATIMELLQDMQVPVTWS